MLIWDILLSPKNNNSILLILWNLTVGSIDYSSCNTLFVIKTTQSPLKCHKIEQHGSLILNAYIRNGRKSIWQLSVLRPLPICP